MRKSIGLACALLLALATAGAQEQEEESLSMIFFLDHMDATVKIVSNFGNAKDILSPISQLPKDEGRYIRGIGSTSQTAGYGLLTAVIPQGALEVPNWELVVDYAPVWDGGGARTEYGEVSIGTVPSGPLATATLQFDIPATPPFTYEWKQERESLDALKDYLGEEASIAIFLPDGEGDTCRIHSIYIEIPGLAGVSLYDGSMGTPRVLFTTDVDKRSIQMRLRRERKG